jgi:ribosomal protein S12 methylthiotransferase
MPIQHGSDSVLERMRRPERQHTIRERVRRIRSVVPDVAIRTTCIVGFPGETEGDFDRLLAFLEEMQFDRVGAFTYSAQDGTRAGAMADDVPELVKQDRLERLTEIQRLVTGERYESRVGRTVRAMVDREHERGLIQARTVWQADDIDGVTWLPAAGAAPGTLMDVVVKDVDDYDFRAELVSVVSTPHPVMPARRALPIAPSTMGSFGR